MGWLVIIKGGVVSSKTTPRHMHVLRLFSNLASPGPVPAHGMVVSELHGSGR